MRNKFVYILILVALLSGLFINKVQSDDGGLTKKEVEEISGRSISDEEWDYMTKEGTLKIIGTADGPTSIRTISNE